jgi:hypothetical protein
MQNHLLVLEVLRTICALNECAWRIWPQPVPYIFPTASGLNMQNAASIGDAQGAEI